MANDLTKKQEEIRNNQFVSSLYTKINMLEAALHEVENELAKGKRLSHALLDKLNEVWKNDQYLNAFMLYSTHFGDYLANGGIQVVDEQEALEKWVNKK